MIEKILPAVVQYAERFDDHRDVVLFPQEEALIARAVPRRRSEFATARGCAREVLGALGIAPVPITRGERGMPTWPAGVVGSITHCAGYRGAVVARSSELASIGIDAEPDAPLPDGVLAQIAFAGDRFGLESLSDAPVAADRLLFSAKESIYKAWYPLAGRWLGFEDVAVTFRPDCTFTARVLIDGAIDGGRGLAGFTGRWLTEDGLVLTCVTVPAA